MCLIASNKVLRRGLEFKSDGLCGSSRRRGALKFNLRGLKRILYLFPVFFVSRKVIKASFAVSLLVAAATETREERTTASAAVAAVDGQRGAAKAEIRFTHRFLRSPSVVTRTDKKPPSRARSQLFPPPRRHSVPAARRHIPTYYVDVK